MFCQYISFKINYHLKTTYLNIFRQNKTPDTVVPSVNIFPISIQYKL